LNERLSLILTFITVGQLAELHQNPLNCLGNGTQALMMPLNEASHAEDLAIKGGKPPTGPIAKGGKRRKGWKGFYGSVHDIVSRSICWFCD
jgi:hypothetical protein